MIDQAGSAPNMGKAQALARFWLGLPATVRAVVVGIAILSFVGGVSGAMMYVNLQTAPEAPWFLLATLIWLGLTWLYLNGAGWPSSSSAARHEALQAGRLSGQQWVWALIAGGLGVLAVMGVAFFTYQHAELPEAAYRPEFAVANFPWWTIVAVFASLALTAGVVEEAAFRGYMLSGVQRRHGWIAAIAIVTLVFYAAHLTHAYATIAFAPFFLLHGLVFGLIVYFTRSILLRARSLALAKHYCGEGGASP